METLEKRIIASTRKILRLYHDNVDLYTAAELMQTQDISYNFVKAFYDQLSEDDERQKTQRFNYYTIKPEFSYGIEFVSLWTSRYLLAYYKSYNSASHHITVIDVFNNKSIRVLIEKSAEKLLDFYPVKDGFGLLKEKGEINSFISLIFLDLHRHCLKKLHTIEYQGDNIQIVVNKADPTTFILTHRIADERSSRMCKIVDSAIIFKEVVEIDFSPECFYGKYVYGNKKGGYYLGIPQIDTYNFEEKAKDQFDLELPYGYTIHVDGIEWVRDNAFFWLEDKNGATVFGYYNVQTHKCNILDFPLELFLGTITVVEQGNLIVHTCYSETHQFYKIPFGTPDLLENTAWLSLVNAMKKRETVFDSYEAARKYLPPNSAINCPFDKPDKDEDEPEKKRSKLE